MTMFENEKCDAKKEKVEPADYEKAINATGFGFFNLLLLLVVIPATLGNVFETSTMSYILPVAECDLKLTLFDKGVLNAATYAGMISSAIIWGYLADTQGRRRVLLYGYMADAICVFASSLSQNLEMLVVFKFLGGFCVNGPGAVLFTYLTELHCSKYRPRVIMLLGVFTSLATFALPLLAWAIFPRDWNFILFQYFDIHSWNVFLFVCGLPSLISYLLFMILPESPKFLMSQGRNTEALRAFQKIYAINTRQPRETFPIHELVEEVPSREGNANEEIYTIDNPPSSMRKKVKPERRSFLQAFREGMQQMKPMFKKPLLGHSIHVYTMQFCILLGLNTIRLWLPQLFASIAEYETLHSTDESSANLCAILEYSVNRTDSVAKDYAVNCSSRKQVSIDMYINNIIVAVTSLVGYFLASIIVRFIGAKGILTYGLIISGFSGLGLYWSSNSLTTIIISSLFIAVASIATSSLVGVAVTLFPTSLRSLIVCVAMMFGRLGALSGNMLFPIFIEIGCLPPFLMVGLMLLFAGGLSCLLSSGKKSTFT